MSNVLVTGGAGFIGSHLTAELVKQGNQVRVLDNLSTGDLSNLQEVIESIELVEGDLLSQDDVTRAVEGIDTVFHHAALASVPRSIRDPLETNAADVTGTVSLLDAARKANVRRVVYAGSSAAYGNSPKPAKSETDLPNTLSPYAAAKLAAEFYCQAFYSSYGLETVCVRYFNVFGPRQDPESEYSAVIPKFVSLMIAGKQPTVFGTGHQSRDFTYVDDVVSGNLAAAAAPSSVAGKTFNIACGRQLNLLQLIAAINASIGTNIEPIFADPQPGDVLESLADISEARAHLNYEPKIDFEEGLRRSIDYYRSVAAV